MGSSLSRIQAIIYDRDFPRFPIPDYGKSGNLHFFSVSTEIFGIFFTEMFIGQVVKELFYVKKSILATFSVPIISLCEVKTSVFITVFLPN